MHTLMSPVKETIMASRADFVVAVVFSECTADLAAKFVPAVAVQ